MLLSVAMMAMIRNSFCPRILNILCLDFFKELYLTGFTLLFRIGGSSWTPRINAWRGVTGIAIIEAVILIGIEWWIEMLIGTRFSFDSDRLAIGIASVALFFANDYVLVARGHGIKYEREFNNLKKFRKVLLVASCVVIMLAVIAFFIVSVAAYRRFNHVS